MTFLSLKEKFDKFDLIKILNSCSVKNTIKKIKDKSKTERNICKSHLTRDLYLELSKFNSKKINNPIKKWSKDLNRHLIEKDIQMAIST